MTCTHEQGKGACWNCQPGMFMYSPEDVARMNAWLAMRQRRVVQAPMPTHEEMEAARPALPKSDYRDKWTKVRHKLMVHG
jgi:hypothetical protein